MKVGNNSILIHKHVSEEKSVWSCILLTCVDPNEGTDNPEDEIIADSFPELMVEIGNKNWIDLINKSK